MDSLLKFLQNPLFFTLAFQEKTGMKLTQKGFLRIYNINFLLVTLAFLSLMRIAYSQSESYLNN